MVINAQEEQIQEPVITRRSADSEARTHIFAVAMFGVLLVSYVVMAADRYLFPVLAPDVRRDLGFTLTKTGLLSTIFTLGLAVGGLPSGYLLLRFSRKTVLLAWIMIFSTSTVLTAITRGFWGMLVCLAIMGIGMAMLATVMFTLASTYFFRHRAAAIGSVNLCYGIGGMMGPILAGALLITYGTWRIPMAAFGLLGFLMVAVIALAVRRWFSETRRAVEVQADRGGAPSLVNRNTILLTALSLIHGLVLYGFLGMYPTYLREGLHYAPRTAGLAMSFFGLGATLSIAGGWLGDRFSPRLVLSVAFLCTSALGYLVFHGSSAMVPQATLSCAYGILTSAVLYVNLAGYHVKALRSSLAARGSGIFVTSLYGSSAVAGYSMGWLVNQGGWVLAGAIQISLLSLVAAILALALRPDQMS